MSDVEAAGFHSRSNSSTTRARQQHLCSSTASPSISIFPKCMYSSNFKLVHESYGHLHPRYIRKLFPLLQISESQIKNFSCDVCKIASSKRSSLHHSISSQSKKPLELIHFDLEPVNVPSLFNSSKYIMTIMWISW